MLDKFSGAAAAGPWICALGNTVVEDRRTCTETRPGVHCYSAPSTGTRGGGRGSSMKESHS